MIFHFLDDVDEHVIEGISKELIISNEIECQQVIINQVYKCLVLGQGIMYLDIENCSIQDLGTVKVYKLELEKIHLFRKVLLSCIWISN